MIIVLGSVEVSPSHLAAALQLAKEHVQRSRAEPGCISHKVHEDLETPNLLTFVEEWESEQALLRHFAVPESITFAKEIGKLGTSRPQIKMYSATELTFPKVKA